MRAGVDIYGALISAFIVLAATLTAWAVTLAMEVSGGVTGAAPAWFVSVILVWVAGAGALLVGGQWGEAIFKCVQAGVLLYAAGRLVAGLL